HFHGVHIHGRKCITECLSTFQHSQVDLWVSCSCQSSKSSQIVFTIHRGDYDFCLISRSEFSVHHHTGQPTVSIQKWMYLTDHKHNKCRFGKRMGKGSI